MIIQNLNNINIVDISKPVINQEKLLVNQIVNNYDNYHTQDNNKFGGMANLSNLIGDTPALLLWGSLWFIPLIFVAWFLWRRNKGV